MAGIVLADVTDDSPVRNVEFYLDGRRALVDGNFPFEFRFVAPRLIDQPTLTLQAKATDTGGNFTWTPEYILGVIHKFTINAGHGKPKKENGYYGRTRRHLLNEIHRLFASFR